MKSVYNAEIFIASINVFAVYQYQQVQDLKNMNRSNEKWYHKDGQYMLYQFEKQFQELHCQFLVLIFYRASRLTFEHKKVMCHGS